MALTSRDLARALFGATNGKSDKEIKAIINRFVAKVKAMGLTALLPEVSGRYDAIVATSGDIVAVTVEAAREPSPDDIAAAVKALGLDLKKTDVTVHLSPDLIGGLRVRTSDRVIDMTVRRRLADLAQALNVN